MTTQTFSLDELRGMVAICEEHGATEVTPIDWRPDAPVTVLRLEPGGGVVAIDDAGCVVDTQTLEVS